MEVRTRAPVVDGCRQPVKRASHGGAPTSRGATEAPCPGGGVVRAGRDGSSHRDHDIGERADAALRTKKFGSARPHEPDGNGQTIAPPRATIRAKSGAFTFGEKVRAPVGRTPR